VLFRRELVDRTHQEGMLRPFISGARPTEPVPQERQDPYLPPMKPLLQQNKLYLRQKQKEADRGLSKKRRHSDGPLRRVTRDTLCDNLHEASLLHERHGYRIPWDFGLRKGLRDYADGDYRRAVRYFGRISEQLGGSVGLKHSLLGTAYYKMGKFQKAEEAFSTALERSGGEGDPLLLFNRSVARTQLCKHTEAIKDLTSAIYQVRSSLIV
jgi:tetratricopeptide (TPR) repeat protein